MTPESLEEWYQERASIMEHCGGLPKEKAEALARAELDGHKRAIAEKTVFSCMACYPKLCHCRSGVVE